MNSVSNISNFYFSAKLITIFIIIFISKLIHGKASSLLTRLNLTDTNMKFILIWTQGLNSPIPFNLKVDPKDVPFKKLSCKYQNCYITLDKYLFINYSNFHAILFHGKEVYRMEYPQKRRKFQYYVDVMDESADIYPMDICDLNNFFNLTITYRLDSDIPWPYYKIIDKTDKNKVVGPRIDMKWKKSRGKLKKEFISKLSNKRKLGAWFVSNCLTRNSRGYFTAFLLEYLRKMSNLTLDVFGGCSPLRCPNESYKDCDKMLSDNYLFYLAFENSHTEDYVTEKVLRALQNNVVPVVYGGANYSRFLPRGSYLDARKLGAKNLAVLMIYLYWNRQAYAKFFHWKNTYEFKSNVLGYSCELCAILNSKNRKRYSHANFVDWWAGKAKRTNDVPFFIPNKNR